MPVSLFYITPRSGVTMIQSKPIHPRLENKTTVLFLSGTTDPDTEFYFLAVGTHDKIKRKQ